MLLPVYVENYIRHKKRKNPFVLSGKAAWQNWSYKVFVQNMRTQAITNHTTEYRACAVTNLTEDTPYTIKVLAFSKSGAGPLSSEFQGRTLESFRHPQIIWAGSEGLYKSDMTLDHVEKLVHKDRMRNIGFNSVTWYRDQIFLVSIYLGLLLYILLYIHYLESIFLCLFPGDQQQQRVLVQFDVTPTGQTGRCGLGGQHRCRLDWAQALLVQLEAATGRFWCFRTILIGVESTLRVVADHPQQPPRLAAGAPAHPHSRQRDQDRLTQWLFILVAGV